MDRKGTLRPALMMLAPYLAVSVFWLGMSSAWLAILAYHAQIILWARGRVFGRFPAGGDVQSGTSRKKAFGFVAVLSLAGPLMYFLLPYVTRVELSAWLAGHGLKGMSLWVMVPYFGIVQPVLEQAHWAELWKTGPASHPVFAGYHLLVLHSLLPWPWLVIAFAVLTAVSMVWRRMPEVQGRLTLPLVTHILADCGLAVAALLRS